MNITELHLIAILEERSLHHIQTYIQFNSIQVGLFSSYHYIEVLILLRTET